MPDDKSPGPNGYSAYFFKRFWTIVGDDVIDAVRSFFFSGKLPRWVNSVALALIPKKLNASTMGDFRPISCCNMIYKVVSKVLANRLSQVLPSLISPSQSAFIRGRSICDNVILAHEILRNYNQQHISPRCTIKIDLRKAFDSVEWSFIISVLQAMRFSSLFISWISTCFASTMISVNFNGALCGYFPAKRGLRQGDPISPYLFVISMEILSFLFARDASTGLFAYHPQCKSVKLTHLCFADDLMVFTKADIHSVQGVRAVLQQFHSVSGLQHNPEKSDIFVAGVDGTTAEAVVLHSGFRRGIMPFRYLGVPLSAGKLKRHDCRILLDKITARVRDWKAKLLSYAGRLQLIESVVGGILQYWMSMFLLPKSLLRDIEIVCSKFLWGTSESGRSKVAWKHLALPKTEGGLGLKDLASWNVANVLRHIWNLLAQSGSIWVAWAYKYRLKVGGVWGFQSSVGSWHWHRIMKLRLVAANFVSTSSTGDLLWDGKLFPHFQVRVVWESIRPRAPIVPWAKLVWSGFRIPRHCVITWLVIRPRLSTRDKIVVWDPFVLRHCLFCSDEDEYHGHIFFECSYSKEVLKAFFPELSCCDWATVLHHASSCWSGPSPFARFKRLAWCVMVSMLWRERCARVFTSQQLQSATLCCKIKEQLLLYVTDQPAYSSLGSSL
ncbi:LINE-1 retrotransposable element ORF2 protein [Linum grandiflorum]